MSVGTCAACSTLVGTCARVKNIRDICKHIDMEAMTFF
jgi:hypothetical protein